MGDNPDVGLHLTDAEGNLLFPNDPAKRAEEIQRRKNPPTVVEAVRGPVSNPQAKSIRKAFRQNLALQARKLPENIVVINERVQLKEDNFIPVEGGNIGFSAEYFPNNIKTPTEILKAKVAFAKVFKPGVLDLENPQPPCDSDEYGILREGLHNRLNRIRSQLRIYKLNEGESVHVRGLQEQAARIKKLLDDIEDKPCNDLYDANENESSFGTDKISGIDNDKMHVLIRNFAFLVLQALNPIEGFENVMNIDPVDFINVLDNPNLTPDIMKNFLQEYQTRDYQIPSLIAAILADTNTQRTMLGIMLEQEKKKILERVIEFVTEKTTGFSEFQKNLGGEAGDQIIKIIQWIIDKLTASAAELSLRNGEITDLKTQITQLTMRITNLESAIKEAEANGAPAGASSGAPAGASSGANPEPMTDVSGFAISRLEKQLIMLQRELDECRAARQELEGRLVKNNDGVAVTQGEYDSLVQALDKATFDLGKSVTENGRLEGEIKKITAEKAGVDAELAALKEKTPESEQKSARLIGRIQELAQKSKDYDKNLAELNKLRGEVGGLNTKLQASEASKRALEAQISGLKESITGLQRDREKLTRALAGARSGHQSRGAEEAAKIAGYEAEIASKNAEIARNQAELDRISEEHGNYRGQLAAADAAAAAARGAAGASAATNTARQRLLDIAKRIVAGTITTSEIDGDTDIGDDDKATFKALLAKFSEQGTNNSIDFCYLNYFVGFFMRELKFTGATRAAIEERVNTVRDTMGKLQDIFTTLQSETGAPLDDFFRGVPDVDVAIYQRKFPDFYEKVNSIKYTVSGSSNPLTPMATIGNSSSISHLTLFTYFLFFARKYLIDNKEAFGTKCPISEFVTNGPSEPAAARPSVPITVAETVAPSSFLQPILSSGGPAEQVKVVTTIENSHAKTMMKILSILFHGGSGNSFRVPTSVVNDPDVSAKNLNLIKFPIMKFIKANTSINGQFFQKTLIESDYNYTDLTDEDIEMNKSRFAKIFNNVYTNYSITHPVEQTNKFIKNILLQFFKAYTKQYMVFDNINTSLEEKAKVFIEFFTNYIGMAPITIIKKEAGKITSKITSTIYELTGLDNDQMIAYTIAP